MWSRRLLLLLVLCLPLRLWAGVGLMGAALPTAPTQLNVHSTQVEPDRPCHEMDVGDAQPVSNDVADVHCNGGDCRICSACHMPALHALGLMEFSHKAPRVWVALDRSSSSSAPLTAPFKPPVS